VILYYHKGIALARKIAHGLLACRRPSPGGLLVRFVLRQAQDLLTVLPTRRGRHARVNRSLGQKKPALTPRHSSWPYARANRLALPPWGQVDPDNNFPEPCPEQSQREPVPKAFFRYWPVYEDLILVTSSGVPSATR